MDKVNILHMVQDNSIASEESNEHYISM